MQLPVINGRNGINNRGAGSFGVSHFVNYVWRRKGNDLFRDGNFVDSIPFYSDAIKRDPAGGFALIYKSAVMAKTAGQGGALIYLLVMVKTLGQWHALIDCYGQHRRPVLRPY